jgi:hypothetical protein
VLSWSDPHATHPQYFASLISVGLCAFWWLRVAALVLLPVLNLVGLKVLRVYGWPFLWMGWFTVESAGVRYGLPFALIPMREFSMGTDGVCRTGIFSAPAFLWVLGLLATAAATALAWLTVQRPPRSSLRQTRAPRVFAPASNGQTGA